MNRAQRAILALGMLGLVAMLMWVPYEATYKWNKATLSADAGYEWVFTPPNAVICQTAIEEYADRNFGYVFDPKRCEVRLDLRRLGLTMAAAVLGIGALMIILGLLGRREHPPAALGREPTLAELSGTTGYRPRSDMAHALLARNPGLPIGSGDLSEADPLVITARTNYIPAEYHVMEAFHADWEGVEFALKTQGLSNRNGRKIDELTYRYRKAGDEEWGHEKTYYFDVTIGMAELRRSIERRWWQFWK